MKGKNVEWRRVSSCLCRPLCHSSSVPAWLRTWCFFRINPSPQMTCPQTPPDFLLSQSLSKIAFESYSSASQMLLPQSLESEWHCMFQPLKRTFMEGNWANWGSKTPQETMCFDKKRRLANVKDFLDYLFIFLWVIMMILWIIILCHSCLDVWLFCQWIKLFCCPYF